MPARSAFLLGALMMAVVLSRGGDMPAWPRETREDFSAPPLAPAGLWRVAGDASLFQWNQAEEALQVTWDSGRTNSYFYQPLGTVLTGADDFFASFDLVLEDIAIGVRPDKPFTFEIALGFIDLASATSGSFVRGQAAGVKNIVEFNYFPAFSVFAPTVALTMVSSNRQFAFSHNFPVGLAPGDVYTVALLHAAATRTWSAEIQRNGQPFVPLEPARADASFSDFQVDAFSISSYSDAQADGSILAHGRVDNVRLGWPPAPVERIAGDWEDGRWRVTFASQTNWLYHLERARRLGDWEILEPARPGTGALMSLVDEEPARRGFYRVRAQRR